MHIMSSPITYTTADVAVKAGVHKDTILRWLRQGVIKEPERNQFGWRLFSEKDANAIIKFATTKTTADAVAVPATNDIQNRLSAIDWDFAKVKTDSLTHSLHPYPAKYIPQIPNYLIQELSSVGDTVYDPFCGSGTTLVEALLLKRNTIGVDANPLACLIAKAKTSRLSDKSLDSLRELSVRALSASKETAAKETVSDKFLKATGFSDEQLVDLNFWFPSVSISELAIIRSWLPELAPDVRIVAQVAFSSIIVAVSHQDSDTRYVRRDKQIKSGDCYRKFSRSLELAVTRLQEFADITEPRFACNIVNANILSAPPLPQVDLVVTSPPYPNAYSYHLYHRTRMLWLGLDQAKFKTEEIGSHRKYSKKSPTLTKIGTFKTELTNIFQYLRRLVKHKGHVCFVVGNSTVDGQVFNNASIVVETASTVGFVEAARVFRNMNSGKKSFNPAIGKITTEDIVVLQNS